MRVGDEGDDDDVATGIDGVAGPGDLATTEAEEGTSAAAATAAAAATDAPIDVSSTAAGTGSGVGKCKRSRHNMKHTKFSS